MSSLSPSKGMSLDSLRMKRRQAHQAAESRRQYQLELEARVEDLEYRIGLLSSRDSEDPPTRIDSTERLPEYYGPPLSTLAEDIWEAMFTRAKSRHEQTNRDNYNLKLKLEREKTYSTNPVHVAAVDFRRATLEEKIMAMGQETRAMEIILHWIKHGGREALKQAEDVLEKRRVKPTNIKQHIKQLMELMEQEFWHTQHPTSSRTDGPDWRLVPLVLVDTNRIILRFFRTLREEIPKLTGMHQSLGLEYFSLEAQLSLDKILRLSSWTPSSTHNKNLRELLKNALLILNDLGDNKEYHDDLRDFMKRHTAFCAFTLDNAYTITAEDSEGTADLCKNLRRLAQNLGKIASTKADQYQKLYENFIAHKEDLSHWLDLASPGQGRSLVDNFTDSLKDMASSMRREANFWSSQSNQFEKWPDISETYGRAVITMPPFSSEQLELSNHSSSTTPSNHGSDTQNTDRDSEPQHVPQAAQRVLTTFANLQKLRVNTTQAFLAKSENSISKRMRETHGYLELAVEVAEKQLSQPSEGCVVPKMMARLAEKALCITKRWNKLHRKVKYWGSILSIFSKPLAYQTFDMISGISRNDFIDRVIASPDTLIHPYVIEFELSLRDMWHHFLSRTHFWARVDSDPDTFTSWRLAFLNEI